MKGVNVWKQKVERRQVSEAEKAGRIAQRKEIMGKIPRAFPARVWWEHLA